MPWYQDLSVYGVGDTYLGVTGPLFLAGVFILALSGFTALMIGMPMMGKRFLKLPVKGSLIAMIAGVQSLFLLLIANSVFYHSKFGVSISHKEPGFGMTIALLATIGLVLGSYFWFKEEFAYKGFNEEVGRKEPLIRMKSEIEREQRTVSEEPYGKKQPLRGFGFPASEKISEKGESDKNEKSGEVTVEEAEKTNQMPGHGGKEENMKIRMDL